MSSGSLGDWLQLARVPIAAGVFEPFGLTRRPQIAAISMSGSSVLLAVNALELKRLDLPKREAAPGEPSSPIRLDTLSANRWFRDPRACDRASLTGWRREA
jgi:hypothetical protein